MHYKHKCRRRTPKLETYVFGCCEIAEKGNVFKGDGVAVDSGGNLAFAEDGHCVTLLGVKDLIVVQSGDATMVCHKDRAQEVKALAQQVAEKHPGLS